MEFEAMLDKLRKWQVYNGIVFDEKARKRGIFNSKNSQLRLFCRYQIVRMVRRDAAGETTYFVIEDIQYCQILEKWFTKKSCKESLSRNYPNYQDPFAYWD